MFMCVHVYFAVSAASCPACLTSPGFDAERVGGVGSVERKLNPGSLMQAVCLFVNLCSFPGNLEPPLLLPVSVHPGYRSGVPAVRAHFMGVPPLSRPPVLGG